MSADDSRTKPWWRRVLGLFGSIYAVAQMAGFPQSLFVWARCAYRRGDACASFRQAINDMPSSLWTPFDPWRLFNVALFTVCLMLLFGLPRAMFRLPSLRLHNRREKDERALATEDAQERLTWNIKDLERLLAKGRSIKPPTEKRWSGGDVSPAFPPGRLRSECYESGEWSGRVLMKLKEMNEKTLEQYFQGCVGIEDVDSRLKCWIERLTRIISELKKRAR